MSENLKTLTVIKDRVADNLMSIHEFNTRLKLMLERLNGAGDSACPAGEEVALTEEGILVALDRISAEETNAIDAARDHLTKLEELF